jgi:beta-mannosidase
MTPSAERIAVTSGWEVAAAEPGEQPRDDAWIPASVPGTVAGALRASGLADEQRDLDAEDWWFRVTLPAVSDELVTLELDGIATVADVMLDDEVLLRSSSMFARHEVDVTGRVASPAQLAIRCHALRPLLGPRTPRARWRTKIADGGLRFHRTMLLGRMPGVAPWPAAVGPWRPVCLRRGRGCTARDISLRARLEGTTGILDVDAPVGAAVELRGPTGVVRGEAGTPLVVSDVATWWPHTHGAPALYRVSVELADDLLDVGAIGFRSIAPGPVGHDIERDGLDLHVNGVRVFARGAVWTPADPVALTDAAARPLLERARDAGFNMVRVPGTSTYESPSFHDACDELGILVWQDLMFANFDYPFSDDAFRRTIEDEVRTVVHDIGGRPSTAVLCGGSEVEQQVAMLGLDPSLARDPLLGDLVAAADLGIPFVPSAPCGGDLPFRPGVGIANYYGVGGYRRPLSDVRLAGVRFAAECLALANVPDGVDPLADPPRDAGASWDFADVRDHYLGELYAVDARQLRTDDVDRYTIVSRTVSGAVMEHVFGDWRRAGSGCGGGLVLWFRDLRPGCGWGVLDVHGQPKVAYHHLRRALAPVAVWTTDEGLGGIDVHIANDGPEPLDATVRVALYRDREQLVDGGDTSLVVAPHATTSVGVEAILGRFADVSYAYRFGPPSHDLVAVTLESGGAILGTAVREPLGRRIAVETAEQLGLSATARRHDAAMAIELTCTRFVDGLRVAAPGFEPSDDAFPLLPNTTRTIILRGDDGAPWSGATVHAVNLDGSLEIVAVP